MHNRLLQLFEQIEQVSEVPSFSFKLDSSAFKELGVAMEMLQVAVEELQQQNEMLTEALESVASEHQRYQSLFQFAPEAYLVTSLEGTIQEANRMAGEMLGVPAQQLIGGAIASFFNECDRSTLKVELLRRQQRDYFQEWEICLEFQHQKALDAACIVVAERDQNGNPIRYRWTIRNITERKRIAALERYQPDLNTDTIPLQNRPLHWFNQGDLIPLYPQTVWYVTQGLVKLTNLPEENKEVLLGFVGPGMPFGAYLTTLPLYEAIAVSDVQRTNVVQVIRQIRNGKIKRCGLLADMG